jgi:hypothetical protein
MFHETAMHEKLFKNNFPLHYNNETKSCDSGYKLSGSICISIAASPEEKRFYHTL